MTSADFIIGLIYFLMIIIVALLVKPRFTTKETRVYFIPALIFKMVAAISLGLLYQFYYVGEGGDTFGYYAGAKTIWQYFLDKPIDAFRVIFWNNEIGNGMYMLVSRIPHFQDSSSFFVDRVAGFFGLFTFGNYTGIALMFGVLSFSGSWALYKTLLGKYPKLGRTLAIATLFIPSVVFWGSGILKDTLTYAGFCFTIWAFNNVIFLRRRQFTSIVVLAISLIAIFSIKKYILLLLVPSLIIWFYMSSLNLVRIKAIRYIIAPVMLIGFLYSGYRSVLIIGENDPRYSISNISSTVYITAHDIRYWTGKEAGSGYNLGKIPENWTEMISLLPAAVNVSMFRPYLWEVNNPLMLLAALESTIFLVVTILLLVRQRFKLPGLILRDPFLVFALVFVIGFGFAVGISTWNFGTLIRYKLPMMPIFASFLAILWSTKNQEVEHRHRL